MKLSHCGCGGVATFAHKLCVNDLNILLRVECQKCGQRTHQAISDSLDNAKTNAAKQWDLIRNAGGDK